MSAAAGKTETPVRVGDAITAETRVCDEIQSFLYNAVLFNAHRIHFDRPYATDVEDYPGLVVAGPLIGDWLHQCVERWLAGRGRLMRIAYSNRGAAYTGDELVVGGEVTAVDGEKCEAELALYVRNRDGDNIAPGTATVRFESGGQ